MRIATASSSADATNPARTSGDFFIRSLLVSGPAQGSGAWGCPRPCPRLPSFHQAELRRLVDTHIWPCGRPGAGSGPTRGSPHEHVWKVEARDGIVIHHAPLGRGAGRP